MAPRRTLGVLSPELGGEYFGGLIQGINSGAREHQARVLAIQTIDSWLPPSEHRHWRFNHRLAWECVDGWVVILNAANAGYLRELQQAGKPVVALGAAVPGLSCPVVRPDNWGGIKAATEHLIAHGHRRIAFAGLLHQPDIRQRYEGYLDTLEQHGIEHDPSLCFNTEDNLTASGIQVGKELIERGMPCTALLGGDFIAMGAIEALNAAGYSVPDNLALIGFDDVREAQHVRPSLSSVRQLYQSLGLRAANLLLQLLDGQEVPPEPSYVETTLIVRESCGCTSATSSLLPDEETSEQGLASALISLASTSRSLQSGTAHEAAARNIARALRQAVVADQASALTSALQQDWNTLIALAPSLDSAHDMQELLLQFGKALSRRRPDALQARDRLDRCMSTFRLWTARWRERALAGYSAQLEGLLSTSYQINMELLGAEMDPRALAWLSWTPTDWACLALWRNQQTESEQLLIAGCHSRAQETPIELGSQLSIRSFPPIPALDLALDADPNAIVIVTPVKTRTMDWGFLAQVGPISDTAFSAGRQTTGQWAAQLGAALERAALLLSLETARRTAEEASELKSKFLANMSHELRTPLNAVINFSQILNSQLHGPLNEQQSTYLSMISQSGEHLLELINDILDLAKIEAGQLALACEQLELGPLLSESVETLKLLAGSKGLALTIELPEQLPNVLGDRARIRQVLTNLLSNAIKFTKEGGITIMAHSRDDGLVEVGVRDTGIGIAPEHHQLVFEEFRQIQDNLNREYQGTGLGLPISRRIVELHGGTIWLESSPCQGSKFSFTLPVSQAAG